MKFLQGINPYLVAGVAMLVLALGTFGGCQYYRAESEQAKRMQVEVGLDAAVAANHAMEATIATQDKALNQWAKIGLAPDEILQVIKAANRFATDLAVARAENAKLKELDRANPDCEALLRVDFGAVCPNRARILREYEGRYPNPDG